TSTLSAGVNLPSRVVIVKDFKRYITSGHNIKNFSGYYENNGFSYFMPFSANSIFQMLGRAGRPGLDEEGFGYLLVKDVDERDWVEDHYFQNALQSEVYTPKYNDLTSGLNKINTLKEQVLLRIYEEKNITLDKLKEFFQKTYFWYGIKNKMQRQGIPIDQLLMIKEVTPKNILKLHSDPQKVKKLMVTHHQIKITKLTKSNLSGYVKTDFGVFFTEFDTDIGIRCSCGFQNGISNDEQLTFEFCDHITALLLHLINIPDNNFQKYVSDIVPKSVKNQYILNYLFEKGLITKRDNGTIKCSQFGKLIIRLYLYPVSGVLIRYKLENAAMETFQDLAKEAYEVLKAELKVRDYRLLQPILEWCDEEPLDDIIERHNIMTGDLYTTRDNLERIITFIGIIAIHLSESDLDLQEDMTKIAEMAETLKIRIHYGISEELFDLVIRLDNVARVR
ncbi:unnamed protein product, partial [marine sediment metagenome]